MLPFKPSNELSYQAPSSAIPSLDGSANDRSSALGRRLSQSSLPNIPNNNKRLSGAPQGNTKKLRRELPEPTKADEQREGLADGQGIETGRNTLIGSAPREGSEDELLGLTSSTAFSTYINDAGHPLDTLSLVDFLNTPLDPNSSENLLTNLSQGDLSLDFLGDSNPNEDNLLKNQDFEIDFETEPKDSHSAFLSGEPQSLERNANQVEQEQMEKNPGLVTTSKKTEGKGDKIRAFIEKHSISITAPRLKIEFETAHPTVNCPSLEYFKKVLSQVRKEQIAKNPELETPWKKTLPVRGQRDKVRALIEKHSISITAPRLKIEFETAHPTADCPSLGYFKKVLSQVRTEQIAKNPELETPWKKTEGIGDKVQALIEKHSISITAPRLKIEFETAHPTANCSSLKYFESILTQARKEQIAKNPELETPWKKTEGKGDKIRALIKKHSVSITAPRLKIEFETAHPTANCPSPKYFESILTQARKEQKAKSEESRVVESLEEKAARR